MAPRNKTENTLLAIWSQVVKTSKVIQKVANRSNAAHIMMLLFVSLNSVGAYMIAPAYGFITAGICSGIYGYLLGRE